MEFPRKYLTTLHYLAPAQQTPVQLNIHLLYMLHAFPFLFLNLAKELIRKIKSLKNILDKDASTDCTVKDIRSANTCTPHCRLLILASQQFIAQITGILKQAASPHSYLV